MKCFYNNADSLSNKLHELQISVQEHNPYIVFITEIKPKNSRIQMTENIIRIDGYEVFHNIETDPEGRGICIYVRNDI